MHEKHARQKCISHFILIDQVNIPVLTYLSDSYVLSLEAHP